MKSNMMTDLRKQVFFVVIFLLFATLSNII
ncbi:hypothetical protein CPR19088_GLDEOEPO_02548 [Companilactobacillus paralimentarius]